MPRCSPNVFEPISQYVPETAFKDMEPVCVSLRYALAFMLFIVSFDARSAAGDPPVCAIAFQSLAPVTTRTPPPPVLKKSQRFTLKNKILDIEQIAKQVEETMAAITDLPDGMYMYVIDTRNRTAIMPRTVDPGVSDLPNAVRSEAPFLGSHEGLVRYLRNDRMAAKSVAVDESDVSSQVRLLASGEIVIRDGRVLAISNGSGTYKGDQRHLAYGGEILASLGLPINGRTKRLEYSKGEFSDPHVLANTQARIEIAARRNPEFMALLADTRQVMREIDRKFPDKVAFATSAIASTDVPHEQNLLFKASMFMAKWEEPVDSEIVSLHSAFQNTGEVKVRAWLMALKKYSDSQP